MSFTHLEPGTAEALWAPALRARALPELDLAMDALFVVAAHPDDEALGVGGLMHVAAERGIPVTVVVATDGEGSHPTSATISPADLGQRRRRELREAMGTLAPHADVRFLGIPDGAVLENSGALAAMLEDALSDLRDRSSKPLVVGPWQGDRHRDHRLTGEVAAQLSRDLDLPYLAYPIWLWHWGTPADVPWHAARVVRLREADRAAKRAALAAHESQTRPLSQAPGDEVMLHAGMLAHFDRDVEILLVETGEREATDAGGSIEAGWFEGFYSRHDDPWGFDSRWYEERKRGILLSVLPERRYGRGLELGCATGALTEDLAERCDALVAVDVVEEALTRARQRLGDRPDVTLRRAVLPHEWPDGEYDLIVFSEIGYYWDAPDLESAIGRMLDSLAPDGHLVACHWRHPVADHRLAGDGVHVALRTMPGLVGIVRHEEPDFLLEVFARPPARSVAEKEGLVP